MGLSVDDDVVRVDWDGAPSDEELRDFFQRLSSTLEGLPRYAMIYDTRHASVPTWSQRQLLADLNRVTGPSLRTRCAGVAFVVESAIVRAGVAAMLWMQPMAIPNTIVGTMDEARMFCRNRLRSPS